MDVRTAGLYNGYEPNKKDYMDHILKIKKPYEYFQAGVILFNLNEFRKTYTVEEMLKFAASYQWQLLDQDVLNYLAQGRTKIVDSADTLEFYYIILFFIITIPRVSYIDDTPDIQRSSQCKYQAGKNNGNW